MSPSNFRNQYLTLPTYSFNYAINIGVILFYDVHKQSNAYLIHVNAVIDKGIPEEEHKLLYACRTTVIWLNNLLYNVNEEMVFNKFKEYIKEAEHLK